MNKPNIQVGDLVNVHGQVGEVVELMGDLGFMYKVENEILSYSYKFAIQAEPRKIWMLEGAYETYTAVNRKGKRIVVTIPKDDEPPVRREHNQLARQKYYHNR